MMPDLTGDGDTARLVYLSLVLIMLLASTAILRRQSVAQIFRNALMWIVAFAVFIVGYAYRNDLQGVGYRTLGVLVPGYVAPGPKPGSVMVSKAPDGHFHVRATVGGHVVKLLVDTGASSVVLTPGDADALGIRPREAAFTVPTSTANGHSVTAPVILPDLTIGGISQKNVQALVAQPGALDSSLLGNTFLERLKSYSFEGDRLVLTR
jgi:aspartyl protease family protein